MKKNGFISSALLYGILALFIVVMLSTLAILGNRKLSMDKLRENALTAVESGYTNPGGIYAYYEGLQKPENEMWKDLSGNGHNAKLYNFTGSYYNNDHITFNGTNNYIDTNFSQLDLGQNITISAVLQITDFAAYRGLWGYHDSGLGQGLVAQSFGDVLELGYYNGVNSSVTVQILPDAVKKKLQLTVVIEKGVGVTVYIDGIFYDTQASTDSFIPRNSYNFLIGKSYPADDRYFKGDLYNFVIYKTALTDEDVIKNFQIDQVKYNIM